MQSKIHIALIAFFITASYRLVPLPIGDIARSGLVAMLVVMSSLHRGGRLNISFFKDVWPLFAIMFTALLFDILLGRIGNYLLVIWAQFTACILVASAVYTLTYDEIRRLILISIALLILQLGMIYLQPEFFTEAARRLGVVDPFVTYGRSLERVYFAYFNANAASYSIYLMMLAFFALGRVRPTPLIPSFLIVLVLLILVLLTGSRGGILLSAGFLFTWFLSFRSTGAAILAGIASVGWIVVLPLYNKVVETILLREESNVARLNAMKDYLAQISENPVFGIGIQHLRERIDTLGVKPSHNFFIEVLGMFGVFVGGALLLYLVYKMLIRSGGLSLRVVGFFALAIGVFNNTLLTNWGFLPLLFPVLIKTSAAIRKEERRLDIRPAIKCSVVERPLG